MPSKILFIFLLPIYLIANPVNKEEKTIFLTFDDGPTFGTENVLNVLETQKVPATLFLVGKNTVKNKETYQKILESNYITIANHTYSHANGSYKKFYDNEKKVIEDIKKNNNILSSNSSLLNQSKYLPLRLAGRNVFRLPNLSFNDYSLPKEQRLNEYSKYDKLKEEGFYIYGWDLEWEYNANGELKYTPKELVDKIEYLYKKQNSKSKNKIILLMHDYTFIDNKKGKENLKTFIELLKNDDWKFDSINNYL